MAWTNFYPMNKIYDFLYAFLDFENAKRLIAYGLILIVMMIVRPDGSDHARFAAAAVVQALEGPACLTRTRRHVCLAIEGLTKRFGGFYALNDLQLEVATGDIHALIGPNGAGKTTFFNLVTGVLPADTGEDPFEGEPMRRRARRPGERSRALRAPSRTSGCFRI